MSDWENLFIVVCLAMAQIVSMLTLSRTLKVLYRQLDGMKDDLCEILLLLRLRQRNDEDASFTDVCRAPVEKCGESNYNERQRQQAESRGSGAQSAARSPSLFHSGSEESAKGPLQNETLG